MTEIFRNLKHRLPFMHWNPRKLNLSRFARMLLASCAPDASLVSGGKEDEMPRWFFRSLIVPVVLLWSQYGIFSGLAQSPAKDPSALTGSISGKITLRGKGLSGVIVLVSVARSEFYLPSSQGAPYKGVTDEDGKYIVSGMPAGSYNVVPFAPVYVDQEASRGALRSRLVNLGEGEHLEHIDMALRKGGVVTGKITDADGKPVISQHVSFTPVSGNDRQDPLPLDWEMSQTDDRGIYRVYGLVPGRYLVSVGEGPGSRGPRFFIGTPPPLTYYPGVREEPQATEIEVKEGGEVSDIDIELGRPAKTFTASGRVVIDETGQPLPNVAIVYGIRPPDGKGFQMQKASSNPTNQNGEFTLAGLEPGLYGTFVAGGQNTEFYSDVTAFSIASSDVGGLEIRVRRGLSLAGNVVIEGATDPAVLAKIPTLRITAIAVAAEENVSSYAQLQIAGDGSFKAAGLRPGKVRFYLSQFPTAQEFALVRVERDGADQTEGVEIQPKEQVTGIRVVIGYGTAVLHGQIEIAGGKLSPGSLLSIILFSTNTRSNRTARRAFADSSGKFTFQGLSAGDYEVIVDMLDSGASGSQNRRVHNEKITVVEGAETTVRMVVDLSGYGNRPEKE